MTFHMAHEIKELIDFKEDGMNQKLIAENGDSLAILFALKKEQIIPEHTSPVDAFLYVFEGEITFSAYEHGETPSEYKVKKEEMLFFRKEERHFLTANKDSKFLVVRI